MGVGGSKRRRGGASEKMVFTIDSASHDQRREIQEKIIQAVERLGFSGQPLFSIKLALEEALVNAIKHGNLQDPEKKVFVTANLSSRRTEILVEDQGPGFDRNSVPDPTAEENLEKCSGRGILLMEAYMDRVRWDRGGRRVRLVKEGVVTEKENAESETGEPQ